MARVTIIIPTHNHARLLLGAVRSVLRQTVQDFEIFIIGDGITTETRGAVMQALALDGRIRFFDHPKSPRTGEPYRHMALRESATGEVACYLSDDDLWLPDHLETMCRTLERADMAHSLPLWVNPEGLLSTTLIDLALPEWVKWTLERKENKISLSFAGHTMAFYRRLPHGWRTTPAGYPTDHYMWIQMLGVPGMRASGTGKHTLVGFPAHSRPGWTLERREEELLAWEGKIAEQPAGLPEQARRSLALTFYNIETSYHAMDEYTRHLRAENQRLRNKYTLRGILGRLMKPGRKKEC